jgi:hypothetical protein
MLGMDMNATTDVAADTGESTPVGVCVGGLSEQGHVQRPKASYERAEEDTLWRISS